MKLQGWGKQLFKENIGYKFIALGCSLVLFYSFQTEKIGTRTVSTSIITIMEDPSDSYILVSEFPPQIAIKLEGPMKMLKGLKGEDIGPIIVPISDFNSRKFVFDSSLIESIPKSVHVVRFYPDSIALRFERKIEKLIKVVPIIEGQPHKGRILKTPVKVIPEKVRIKGAESSLKKIRSWETQAIYVKDLSPGEHEIKVNLVPPKNPHITLDEETVTVKVNIEYRYVTKWIRKIPLSIEGMETLSSVAMRPAYVAVLLKGPEEIIESVTEERLNFYVEVSEDDLQKKGGVMKEIKYSSLPELTAVVKLVPARILVSSKPAGKK